MMAVMRVGVTLEHLWHRVPGGTAVATLETLRALTALPEAGELEILGVAGRHREPPAPAWSVPAGVEMRHHRWIAGPLLYEAWSRMRRPTAESIAGTLDVVHSTTILACPARAPRVVTLHDLAFLHDADHFTRRGVSVFTRALRAIRDRATLVLCSSTATLEDAARAGIDRGRLRLVPLGVRPREVTDEDRRRVRDRWELPERYALFVGTVEPRKNLEGLLDALDTLSDPIPLVIVGAEGWGGVADRIRRREQTGSTPVRRLGFVPEEDLGAIYAEAEVFCMPSHREGYGLPVLEAMAQGTPVVTSRGTATEQTAGGAAVLVDPRDPRDIARGLGEVLADREPWADRARRRAGEAPWTVTARATLEAYREAAQERVR